MSTDLKPLADLAFMQRLERESPRGAVLIAAARLHTGLQGLLLAVATSKKSADELLGQGGRADSFGSHILLSHALGLISDDVKTDLNIIRKIRNWGAHHVDEFHFDHDAVGSRCDSLICPRARGFQPKAPDRGERRRSHFLFTAGYITGKLEAVVRIHREAGEEPLPLLGRCLVSYPKDPPADG